MPPRRTKCRQWRNRWAPSAPTCQCTCPTGHRLMIDAKGSWAQEEAPHTVKSRIAAEELTFLECRDILYEPRLVACPGSPLALRLVTARPARIVPVHCLLWKAPVVRAA